MEKNRIWEKFKLNLEKYKKNIVEPHVAVRVQTIFHAMRCAEYLPTRCAVELSIERVYLFVCLMG